MQIKRKKERQHACNVLYKVSPLFINYCCFLILRAVLCGLKPASIFLYSSLLPLTQTNHPPPPSLSLPPFPFSLLYCDNIIYLMKS